ncbi:MAG TPA: DsbA family protein [Polyangia bacterium]|jgi:predicted DsbA family dithiol-disulfide isomerase|nr:DsbA family protein [Polyangia bacterium]
MPSTVLRLFSDFVCPFCFIAEQATVPRLRDQLSITVEWCGFELHPRTPRGGMPLTALFPAARIAALKENLYQFAARFGVGAIRHPDHIPNTRRVLAIAELARDRGRLDAFREAGMVAYWRAGRDLEDDDDLRAIATGVGLPADEALAAADDPALLARVDQRQAEARRLGVTGIPTFIFGSDGRGEAVVGCHPYEVVAAAAQRAGARPRLRSVGDPDGETR